MADTKFVCAVCGSTFTEHEASASAFEVEDDEIRCPTADRHRWSQTTSTRMSRL
jgi:DNA-directed RNA polymerase subunit RPC12/RpoP